MASSSRKPPATRKHPLSGSWSATVDGDSNLAVTVSGSIDRPKIAVVDVFDGERMKVSAVSSSARAVRFRTVTPSTGAEVDHELVVRPDGSAEYRLTSTQIWRRG